jgi:raffinose/stachyose/melibiose transport system permease protein
MSSIAGQRFRFLPQQRPGTDERPRTSREQLLTIALFVIPGAIIYTLFLIWPIVQAGYFSLYKWNGLGAPTDFRGLENYTQAFGHEVFQAAIFNSLIITALSLVVQLPLALILAVMIGRKLPGRMFFRSIFFLPYVFSEVITAIIWGFVYHQNGMFNTIFGSLIPGYEPITWLADRNIALLAVFGVITWKYFGLHMILYMAGLQQISTEIEEAARIDGASEWQVLRYITFPMMAPTIRLTIYLSVLGSLNQFVLIWVLTAGGPAHATQVLATYMYRFGIKSFNLGFGSAIAVIIFAICLVFSIGYQRTIMRRDYAGAVD